MSTFVHHPSRDPGYRSCSKKSFSLWCSNQLSWPDLLLHSLNFYLFIYKQNSMRSYHSDKTIRISSGSSIISDTDQTICQIVVPHGHLATITNFDPHTVAVVSMLFHTALTLTPRLWETLAQQEQSEVKAAEFAYPCTRIDTHKHTHEHARTHKHSNVVLCETTALKKVVWNLVGNPDWLNQSGVLREGMASECSANASIMQPQRAHNTLTPLSQLYTSSSTVWRICSFTFLLRVCLGD